MVCQCWNSEHGSQVWREEQWAGTELPRGGEVSKDGYDMNGNDKWHISVNPGFAPEGLGNVFGEKGAQMNNGRFFTGKRCQSGS